MTPDAEMWGALDAFFGIYLADLPDGDLSRLVL